MVAQSRPTARLVTVRSTTRAAVRRMPWADPHLSFGVLPRCHQPPWVYTAPSGARMRRIRRATEGQSAARHSIRCTPLQTLRCHSPPSNVTSTCCSGRRSSARALSVSACSSAVGQRWWPHAARPETARGHDVHLGGVHHDLRGEEQEEEEPEDDAEEAVELAGVAQLAGDQPAPERLQRGPQHAAHHGTDPEGTGVDRLRREHAEREQVQAHVDRHR